MTSVNTCGGIECETGHRHTSNLREGCRNILALAGKQAIFHKSIRLF